MKSRTYSLQGRAAQGGFTFIELALGLLLLSILSIGIMALYGKYVVQDKRTQTREALQTIRQQLLHFVEINGYLPCPDARGTPDGYGDRIASNPAKGCFRSQGRLPWNEIGAPAKDAWGHYFYYRVNDRATSTTQTHNLCNSAAAGIFGKQGNLTFGARRPYYCTSTKMIYCFTNTLRAGVNAARLCPGGTLQQVVQDTPGPNQIAYVDLMYNALHWSSKTPQPPYIGLFTPPVGGYNTPARDESVYFVKVYSLKWLNPNSLTDPASVIDNRRYSIAGQVVIVSFGAQNSANVWQALTQNNGSIRSQKNYQCPIQITGTTADDRLRQRAEFENCDGDVNFIYDSTKLIDDQLIWIDNNDIKAALKRGGKL